MLKTDQYLNKKFIFLFSKTVDSCSTTDCGFFQCAAVTSVVYCKRKHISITTILITPEIQEVRVCTNIHKSLS